MPVKRRRSLQPANPYAVPQNGTEGKNSKGYRRNDRPRHASWTIEEDRVKEFMGGRENKASGFVSEPSCVSLCGVLDNGIKSPEYRNNAFSDNGRGLSAESRCNSMPADVPLRNATKNNSKTSKKSRSSGGYFFEKYIKRFRSKTPQNVNSDDSDSETSLDTSKIAQKSRSAPKQADKFINNRQDMIVFGLRGNNEYYTIGEDIVSHEIDEDTIADDLYPKRYGLSSDWSTCSVIPSVKYAEIDGEFVPHSHRILPTFYPPETPGSPPPGTVTSPLYWDDQACGFGPVDLNPGTPVTNLLSDYYEASYPCWEYDQDTLKELEWMRWSNYRVTGAGRWMGGGGSDEPVGGGICCKKMRLDALICRRCEIGVDSVHFLRFEKIKFQVSFTFGHILTRVMFFTLSET